MLLLEEAGEGDCVNGAMASGDFVLTRSWKRNGIDVELFRTAVKDLLLCGRCKNRNLLLTGRTNCGKSFLLNPLKVIYRTFCNPVTGTYFMAWSVVDVRRWCSLLARAKDPLFYRHLFPRRHSVFATGKGPLSYIKNGVIDRQEMDMMSSRGRILTLHHQVPREYGKPFVAKFNPCNICLIH